jgi:hypothetical protein
VFSNLAHLIPTIIYLDKIFGWQANKKQSTNTKQSKINKRTENKNKKKKNEKKEKKIEK